MGSLVRVTVRPCQIIGSMFTGFRTASHASGNLYDHASYDLTTVMSMNGSYYYGNGVLTYLKRFLSGSATIVRG